MKTISPLVLIALLSACSSSESEPVSLTAGAEGARAKLSMAMSSTGSREMRCYESTDVDHIPDIALDRPFNYLVRYIASRVDHRVLLSTVIPHEAGMTYKLVDETVVKDTIWKVTFQAYDDEAVLKGLFVHTDHAVPNTFSGRTITEVEIAVLDQRGNSTAEVGGVPGQPKTRKPPRRQMQDAPDEDPTMPPLEDVTIYTNGNLVDGEQYAVGFAFVNGAGSGLSLSNDASTSTVSFAIVTGGTSAEFLFFDQKVTEFGTTPAICTFTDGDGDSGTDPRPNILRP